MMCIKMKIFSVLFKNETNEAVKTVSEKQRESLVAIGREQFKKLSDLGLNVPVALL